MFGNAFQKARDGFEMRFEPEGDDSWLFRPSPTGAPVRVTLAEGDGAVSDFMRGIKWLWWGLVAGIIVMCVLVVWLIGDVENENGDVALYGGMTLVVAIYAAAWWWLWSRPARLFQRRAQAGAARSRDEAHREAMARIGWGQIFAAVAFLAFVSASKLLDDDVSLATKAFFAVIGVVSLGFSILAMWRKWSFRRSSHPK